MTGPKVIREGTITINEFGGIEITGFHIDGTELELKYLVQQRLVLALHFIATDIYDTEHAQIDPVFPPSSSRFKVN